MHVESNDKLNSNKNYESKNKKQEGFNGWKDKLQDWKKFLR